MINKQVFKKFNTAKVLLLFRWIGILKLMFLTLSSHLNAQNRNMAQSYIDTLSSKAFWGRGYTKNGDDLAAQFIANSYLKIGLKTFKNDYFYPFKFDVNTFPGKVNVVINKTKLTCGLQYIPSPDFKTKKAKYKTLYYQNWDKQKTKFAIVIDTSYKLSKSETEVLYKNAACIIRLEKKLTWSVSQDQSIVPELSILKSVFIDNAIININIHSALETNNIAKNVIGYIEGQIKDSFLVITAHYDHLGGLGKNTFFPGANDNASGIAIMLDLAQSFMASKPKYSIVFIAFAAEEIGLLGSKAYTDSPFDEFTLGKIKFLLNLDLMGSGDKGFAVVNGTIFKKEMEVLQSINTKNNYLPHIKLRGKAANSDHYWFTERGVKSFFIYLMGDYTYYHQVEDNATNLKLTEYYDRSFKLIKDFILSF